MFITSFSLPVKHAAHDYTNLWTVPTIPSVTNKRVQPYTSVYFCWRAVLCISVLVRYWNNVEPWITLRHWDCMLTVNMARLFEIYRENNNRVPLLSYRHNICRSSCLSVASGGYLQHLSDLWFAETRADPIVARAHIKTALRKRKSLQLCIYPPWYVILVWAGFVHYKLISDKLHLSTLFALSSRMRVWKQLNS